MDEPPGARFSSGLIGATYGGMIRALRGITNTTVNKEPKWRHPGTRLTTGYKPTGYGRGREV
jgi:hydrogenase small subunit